MASLGGGLGTGVAEAEAGGKGQEPMGLARHPHSVWRHPEQRRVPGADFTNTFYLLSSFPVGPEPPGLPAFLAALTAQCASLEELKLAFRPQMDPRWVPRSRFLGICF